MKTTLKPICTLRLSLCHHSNADNSDFIGHCSGNAMISDNLRSLVAFNSNITFKGEVRFLNNHQPQMTSMNNYFQEGDAMTLVQTNAHLYGIAT